MENIRTINEIKLLRKSLRNKRRYEEEKMKLYSEEIVFKINKIIVGPIIEKGIYSVISYFVKKKKKKRTKNRD